MSGQPTLVLTRSDVRELLSMADCIEAVESAFRAHANGEAWGPDVASVHVEGGGFHVKAAALPLSRPYFAAKTNGNFFHNDRLGLPRIQGTIALCDASNGSPLALLDSIEITILRTSAATAVAARHLANPDASTLALIGCGVQGQASWHALREVLAVERVFLYDTHAAAAEQLAATAEEAGAHPTIVSDPGAAIRSAEVAVTSTPSTTPIVTTDHLHAGLFIAAVGADSEHKQELDPAVLHASRVIVDSLEQAAAIGEVHHAVDESHPAAAIVAATLGEVVSGRKPGRMTRDGVVVFDSTGIAIQDVAAAALVYERALESDRGTLIDLAS